MNNPNYCNSRTRKRRLNPLQKLIRPTSPAHSREARAIAYEAALAILG